MRTTWKDPATRDAKATELLGRFESNYAHPHKYGMPEVWWGRVVAKPKGGLTKLSHELYNLLRCEQLSFIVFSIRPMHFACHLILNKGL